MIRITRRLGGPGCGVPRPARASATREVSRQQGVEWVVEAITQLLPVAREYDVVLAHGEPLQGRLLEVSRSSRRSRMCSWRSCAPSPTARYFGVQYDPPTPSSPATIRSSCCGRWPTAWSACTPATATWPRRTLDELRQSDGTLGYSPNLRHGVTGKGLNDYHAIFRILREAGYEAGSASKTA